MAYVLVRHKVKDYSAWKPGFDDHGNDREAAGSKGGYVFRNADDPNEVLVLLEWDEMENVRSFVHSNDLKEKMQEVGVIDQPDIYFLDQADRPSK